METNDSISENSAINGNVAAIDGDTFNLLSSEFTQNLH